MAALLTGKGDVPLSRLVAKQEIARDYVDLLPTLPAEEWRRIRGEQEIIVSYEPEQAIATLPALLAETEERDRLLVLLERLMADERVQRSKPTAEQQAMLERIRDVLGGKPAPGNASPP
ncbi:hypothetical protein ACFSHR_15675 [Azotobacter chroococcum]